MNQKGNEDVSEDLKIETTEDYISEDTENVNKQDVCETVKEFKMEDKHHCFTCLSVGRKMYSLNEVYDIYEKIIESNYLEELQSIFVCWECYFFLRKIQKFQEKVYTARKLLDNMITNCDSLSTLEIKQISPNLCIDEEYEVKEETQDDIEDNIKIEVIPKEEMDVNNCDNNKTIEMLNDQTHKKLMFNNVSLNDIGIRKHKTKTMDTNISIETAKLNVNSNVNVCEEVNDVNETFDNISDDNDLSNDCEKMSLDIGKKVKNRRWNKIRSEINKEPKLKIINDINMIFDKLNKDNKLNGDDLNERELENKHLVQRHVASDNVLYNCKVCKQNCGRKERQIHVKKKHKIIVQCIKCELLFNGRREFFKHYKNWHENYICDHCGVSFKLKYCLENHMRQMHSSFRCAICVKSFKRRKGLRSHIRLCHTAAPGAYCVECDVSFSNEHRYRRHLTDSVRHNPRTKKKIPCAGCDKVFSKPIYMKEHYNMVHLKYYKNKCEFCDKIFLRSSGLTKHVRTVHEGISPAKNKVCYICGRGFSSNRILKNHVRTHTGERPYVCDVCSAKFTQAGALNTHKRSLHPDTNK